VHIGVSGVHGQCVGVGFHRQLLFAAELCRVDLEFGWVVERVLDELVRRERKTISALDAWDVDPNGVDEHGAADAVVLAMPVGAGSAGKAGVRRDEDVVLV
jgi:hypothetical protein